VSTLTVVSVLVTESVLTVVESVVAEPLPLQAANEVAIARAKKASLNEFFILIKLVLYINCMVNTPNVKR
jgi:uncharacterized protein YqhQ